MKASLGIDVGGTFTKIAVVTGWSGGKPRVLRESELPTNAGRDPRRFVERVASYVHLLSSELGADFAAAGLGVAGDVDSARGMLRFSPNLPGWRGFAFKKAFARALGCPVVVDNDANMAVWGGYVMELGRRPRNVVGLTLGTGVGGGLIIDGRLYRGSTGSAGEIGHSCVEPGGARCGCGMRGCLEAYAGSYGIARTARALVTRGPLKAAAAKGELDPGRLAQAAARGDRAALAVWEFTAEKLAIGLSSLILVYNPDVVLLLGGVSRAGGLLLKPLRRALARNPFKTPFRHASVRMAERHNWGAVGAALLGADALG